MKLDRKLLSATLSLAMVAATVAPASALDLQAQLGEAKYNRVDVNNYSKAINYNNGSVLVTQEAADGSIQYGLANAAGEMVFAFQPNYMEYMTDNVYMLYNTDDTRSLINSAGAVICGPTTEYLNASGDLIYVGNEAYNLDMTPYVPDGEETSDGYSYADERGYIYFGDENGNDGLKAPDGTVIIAPGEYDYFYVLGKGKEAAFVVSDENGGCALLGKDKQVLVPVGTYEKLDNGYSSSQDYLYGVNNDEKVVLDLKGQVMIPHSDFNTVLGVNALGQIAVSRGEAMDVYQNGTLLNTFTQYMYMRTSPNLNTFVAEEKGTGKWSVISADGTVVVPAVYDNISDTKEGYYICSTRDQETYENICTLLDGSGNVVIPEVSGAIREKFTGYYEVEQNGLYGMYSVAAGGYSIPVQYTSLSSASENFIYASKENGGTVLDKNGNVIIPYSESGIGVYDSNVNGSGGNVVYYVMDHQYARSTGYADGAPVLPFAVNTGAGWQTYYVNYETGEQLGVMNGVVASNMNDQGYFAYRADSGLYGVGQATNYVAPGPFADVPGNEYYTEPVTWAVDKGIANGVGNNNFDPNGTCTQAHIITFLWRAYGSPVVEGTSNYPDVTPGDWYYNAVLWAQSAGIIDLAFSPVAPCTRATAVTYMYRAAGMPAVNVTGAFTDVPAADAPAVEWALSLGITNGTGNNTFSPANTCTRAQIVTFLWRAMGK